MAAATVRNVVSSPEALGLAYERQLSRRTRNLNGAFYTPAPVIDYLVEQTIGRLAGSVQPIRVLDPACGGGWFLLAALRRLSIDARDRLDVLRDSIFGIDIDPGAVEVTRKALWLALAESGERPSRSALTVLKENIRCGDTLLDSFDGWERSFDVVLGNPPYLSYSGRQAVPLAAESERHYRERFRSSRGWMTAHGLFVERSLRDFSRRMVGFVLPDQVGHLDGYRPLREVVGELSRVAEVRYWGEDVFERAVTPVLTLVADREHDGPTRIVDRNGTTTIAEFKDVGPWQPRPHASLLAKLFAQSRMLASEVADPGVHTGNCAEHLVLSPLPPSLRGERARLGREGSGNDISPSSLTLYCHPERSEGSRLGPDEILRCAENDKEGEGCAARVAGASAPLSLTLSPRKAGGRGDKKRRASVTVAILEGKQVGRYRCNVPQKHLRLDYAPQASEYFTIRPEAKYRRARFVIRQTAAYPIVGPRRHAVYFRNSLLAIYPPTDGTDVRFLVGLLNSRLLRFVYQALVRESCQAAFPQVKVSSLRKLPIRCIDFKKEPERATHDRIVETVRRLLKANAKREPDGGLIALLDSQLDRLVYDLYGLTEAERAVVEEATR